MVKATLAKTPYRLDAETRRRGQMGEQTGLVSTKSVGPLAKVTAHDGAIFANTQVIIPPNPMAPQDALGWFVKEYDQAP